MKGRSLKMKKSLGGLIASLHTPFFKDYSLNVEGVKENVSFLIDSGIDGVLLTGTAGEFVNLDDEERIAVWKAGQEISDGRIILIAHTGASSTKKTVELTKIAEENNIEFSMVMTPYVTKPTQEEIYQHFKYIAENTKEKILIYNNPGRTGVTIQSDTLTALAKIDNIVGVKDSTRDLRLTMEVIANTKDRNFVVISGEADLIIPIMALGGQGAIITPILINPKPFLSMYRSIEAGDWKAANEYQHDILPLLQCLGKEKKYHAAIKAGIEIMGRKAGPPRPPLQEISDELKKELESLLGKIF